MKNTAASVVQTETQRESIINRPWNFAGSINRVKRERFSVTEEGIELRTSNTVPAVLKLFMEALDNPIDMAIKGSCSKIDIKIDSSSISVKDNGAGVSSTKDDEGVSNVQRAFCIYNSSNNYGENKGKGQKGINGIGIKLCSTLSTSMKVISDDGIKTVELNIQNNNLDVQVHEKKSKGKSGVQITFYPDFSIFEISELDEEHISRMYEYTLMQALTYPNISFTFNGTKVQSTPEKFCRGLHESTVLYKSKDFFFGIAPNELDEFKSLTYINGLEISRGGKHVDYIVNKVVKGVREKLQKKHKGIKPADIKNKIMFVMIGSNMHNIAWEGQVKDSINSTVQDLTDYFSKNEKNQELNLDAFIKSILKNPDIMDPITEFYRLKEERDARVNLKKLDRTKKKPKSEKFMEPIGPWKNIFVCEGDSASASVSKILGREGNGFYAMFGVPPNVWDMPLTGKNSISQSTKLLDLKNIIGIQYSDTEQHSINFENIIITTDYDLPGHFICGLLLGVLGKFGKNLFEEGRVKRFLTPLLIVKNSKEEIITWFYTFEEYQEFVRTRGKSDYIYDYKKGLGSWDATELQHIIEHDGLDNMLVSFAWTEDSKGTLDNWLNKNSADVRKELLHGYEFNIMNS